VPLHRVHEDHRRHRPGGRTEDRAVSDRESLAEGLEDRDVTLALTPAQLIQVVLGLWLLLRIVRSLRRTG
jgi:hypothetical protein